MKRMLSEEKRKGVANDMYQWLMWNDDITSYHNDILHDVDYILTSGSEQMMIIIKDSGCGTVMIDCQETSSIGLFDYVMNKCNGPFKGYYLITKGSISGYSPLKDGTWTQPMFYSLCNFFRDRLVREKEIDDKYKEIVS